MLITPSQYSDAFDKYVRQYIQSIMGLRIQEMALDYFLIFVVTFAFSYPIYKFIERFFPSYFRITKWFWDRTEWYYHPLTFLLNALLGFAALILPALPFFYCATVFMATFRYENVKTTTIILTILGILAVYGFIVLIIRYAYKKIKDWIVKIIQPKHTTGFYQKPEEPDEQ